MLARRKPITAMLNGACAGSPGAWPSAIKLGDVDAALVGPAGKVLVHEIGREPVDAGRDGGVGGEDGPRPGRLDRLGEARGPSG